jgi:hypothetical protein
LLSRCLCGLSELRAKPNPLLATDYRLLATDYWLLLKQTSLLFLLREAGRFGMQGMSGMKEGFLAMQDRRLALGP